MWRRKYGKYGVVVHSGKFKRIFFTFSTLNPYFPFFLLLEFFISNLNVQSDSLHEKNNPNPPDNRRIDMILVHTI